MLEHKLFCHFIFSCIFLYNHYTCLLLILLINVIQYKYQLINVNVLILTQISTPKFFRVALKTKISNMQSYECKHFFI
jgi:hypothetical protein